MLKIVPDPPYTTETNLLLEDLLTQAIDSLMSALALTTSPAQCLPSATQYEIELARRLTDMALSMVQVKH